MGNFPRSIKFARIHCNHLLLGFWLYLLVSNIVRPKSALLAIIDDQLIWSVRKSDSSPPDKTSIPLRSLSAIEVVLPQVMSEVNPKNYLCAELHLVDVHGTRHHLPPELLPGVNQKKIIAALQSEKPDLKVNEYLDKGRT